MHLSSLYHPTQINVGFYEDTANEKSKFALFFLVAGVIRAIAVGSALCAIAAFGVDVGRE
jgi:hypothetical protein